ncbi:hypothetical protein ACM64Y_09265 [Novispirillum sp. DQ9]|uniref:hypothetical protein n=1 Tax=Novispirillum sp. DQ9 TaxID=3398612 RepID=UPI003C7C6F9C
MSAKPAKPPKHSPSGASPPARAPAAASIDADAEKTYFRVRASAFDTLGAPTDPLTPAGPLSSAPATAAACEQGLLSRWLGGAPRPARTPRRRTPPPAEPSATPVPAAGEVLDLDVPILEPDQDAAGPEAVDSYRSASGLTAPEDIPQSDVVA